jgi:hypothetical protein
VIVRLSLDLDLFLYLPPHGEAPMAVNGFPDPLSEIRTPRVCLGGGVPLHVRGCLAGEMTTRPRGRRIASGAHTPPCRRGRRRA